MRDLWDVTPRLQLDLDLRLDGYAGAGVTPSPRLGVRYYARRGRADDAQGERRPVRRPAAARRAGVRPVPGAARSIVRSHDRRTALGTTPTASSARTLELPRADGVALEIERQLRPGLEAQATVRVAQGHATCRR